MLISGDSTDDARLLPGDVVFIPPVGPTVTVDGEVRRPAIYEVKNESTASDVVQLAGGLTPEADTSKASLTRIDETSAASRDEAWIWRAQRRSRSVTETCCRSRV